MGRGWQLSTLEKPQWFCDDHLWLLMAVCAYLRETGNFSYLWNHIPYADEGEDIVWGHMLRAVDFTLNIEARTDCRGWASQIGTIR